MEKEKLHLYDPVFTPHGSAIVVAIFRDDTVCVRFQHGGGMILHKDQVFKKPILTPKGQMATMVA